MLKYFSVLLFLVISFSGCSKSDPKISSLKGTYSGTFYCRYSSVVSPGNATVMFSGDNYQCSDNSTRVPAGGNGSYHIGNQEIQFKDINLWTADFDWGLILNGNYTYQANADSLVLTKSTNSSFYQYRLKRIN
jgi:hypothetical protein